MRRHRFDPISFVFGVLFTVFALAGLADVALPYVFDVRWLVPSLLVVVGLVLLVSSARSGGRDEAAEEGGED